ncbi:LysM peptidoglycan-binding domain-containing protein [Janibacter sp. GS2]|uniref:LysM peptidoglycan-binding domain-containing protein n=1 Tax=Janibacter sp. GS2 TaxID=3442646 RepID=UPI003EC05B29
MSVNGDAARPGNGTRLTGLIALVGLLGLLVGVPWLLLSIGAGPVPDQWATPGEIWSGLTTPDDGAVLLVLFRYAAWIAWLFIAVSVLLEVVARVLGTDVPQIPGFALPQGLARYFVGAVILLFVSAPSMGAWAGSASAAPVTDTGAPTSASSTLTGGVTLTATASDTSATRGAESTKQAPSSPTVEHEVARGETLWSIAEQYLGDGARYTEIVDLNQGTIPSSHWISPGQLLQLPDEGSSTGAGSRADSSTTTHTVERGDTLWEIAEDELGAGDRYPEIVDATGSQQQSDGSRLTDPDLIRPGWELQVPDAGATTSEPAADPQPTTSSPSAGRATPAPPTPSADTGGGGDVTSDADSAERDQAASDPVTLGDPAGSWGPVVLGLGGITAAGLVGLLELARRRRAGHLGRPGSPGAGALERDLRLAADEHTASTIDLALRHIAIAAREAGRALPGLRSVRMARHQIDVQLADPMRLPAPWTSTADPRLWTLSAERAAALHGRGLEEEAAPFPSLVSIGQDEEDAHLLINLAHSRTFAVVGPSVHTRDTLAAMALSLATAPWSCATTVTVVGGHPELADIIDSPRVRFVPDMAAYSLSVQVQIDPSAREVLIVSGDLDATDRRRLDKAVASSPRVSLAHAATDVPDGGESLTITDPSTAVLAPAYLQLAPQHLSADDATLLGELFALAAPSTRAWAPPQGEPTLAQVGAAAAAMGAPGIVVDPEDDLPTDDHPTVRRDDLTDGTATPARWNTPVATPARHPESLPGEDVPTVRRSAGVATTAPTTTPGWLSNQITPTPGTPLPPVIAFPERVRELAAPTDEPVLRLLGPVDVDNVGDVAAAHRMRLTELAAYISSHPDADGAGIDDALWPNRAQQDHSLVRNHSLSALGVWLTGDADAGSDAGWSAAAGLTSDWGLWTRLVPADPTAAGTEHLEQALGLVRGRPLAGVHPRHYIWASELKAAMIYAITTAATELARRRLMEGRWTSALDASVVGLTVEPGVEALWRMQVLAAHELGDAEARATAVAGLGDCGRLREEPLEPASRDLLDTLPELDAAEAPTRSHHVV